MEVVPHIRKSSRRRNRRAGSSRHVRHRLRQGLLRNQNVPSSVAQYTEQQPTASGTLATGQGNKSRGGAKSLQKQMNRGGDDAATITKIVSSKSARAPQTNIRCTRSR